MSQTGTQALITNMQARLEALKLRIQPGACFDNKAQSESFFQFAEYLREFDEIVTDTRMGLIDEVRGWGNQPPMTRVDRKMLREKTNDDRDGSLQEATEWAKYGSRDEVA
ncbi:hypothetical protein WH297_05920 [Ochrobactrum vermis]|uniref:Uncharacterized protein n=1 Tax=Ochrobactrum vermis TaxID=1827297 RepID=A0ABU8PAJ4_9HYPH|nr:hypothetical protein [Ochrobactrum vermis]